ncbi:hypothetical protein [Variovorax ginsengisoli]|uniref:Uncharacterized protein n=1 Tax=Variovorax ginsengisoli TaxID=363844 RepID=A0ABT8S089_9BURK|nr:hypothetical protein [Variovorax ginsengisoli]MDN8612778.1 hypothetical protein [Variovorax ginsengisoli]MDO1531948.1 hypothetical protein [Variovorax ginsengisoli]
MKVTDRYASAVRSSCLTVDERTTFSDTDVLGAMGLAARALTSEGHPLAVALERLFAGDNGASIEIVEVLATMIRGKAPALRLKLTTTQAVDMARACLAWHRDGVCRPCGGHGTLVIPGSRTLGVQQCKPCRGHGKIPFERQFRVEWRDLAAWLVAEMEREQGRAGPAAMKALAPRLDF